MPMGSARYWPYPKPPCQMAPAPVSLYFGMARSRKIRRCRGLVAMAAQSFDHTTVALQPPTQLPEGVLQGRSNSRYSVMLLASLGNGLPVRSDFDFGLLAGAVYRGLIGHDRVILGDCFDPYDLSRASLLFYPSPHRRGER